MQECKSLAVLVTDSADITEEENICQVRDCEIFREG